MSAQIIEVNKLPVARLNALLCNGQTIVDPSPSLKKSKRTKKKHSKSICESTPSVFKRSSKVWATVCNSKNFSVQISRN